MSKGGTQRSASSASAQTPWWNGATPQPMQGGPYGGPVGVHAPVMGQGGPQPSPPTLGGAPIGGPVGVHAPVTAGMPGSSITAGLTAPVQGGAIGAPPGVMPTNSMLPVAHPGLAQPSPPAGAVAPSATAAPGAGASPIPGLLGASNSMSPPAIHPALQGLLNAAGYRGASYG